MSGHGTPQRAATEGGPTPPMLNAFAVTSELSDCTRCGGMRSVGTEEFARRVRGRPYRSLLRYHLRHHDLERVRQALEGSLAVLAPRSRRLALETAEAWRRELADGELGAEDCADLLERLRRRAEASPGAREDARSDGLMDLFEVATLSLVLELRADPGLRRAVGGLAPGFLDRHRWNLAAAAGLLLLAVSVDGPLWQAAVWAGLGLAVLPPLARLVGGRIGSGAVRGRSA